MMIILVLSTRGEKMRKHTIGAALFIACAIFGGEQTVAQTSPDDVVLAEARTARTTPTLRKSPAISTATAEGESEEVARLNAWTVGIAGGLIQGALIRFATDIQVALDDGDNLRILPIVSLGAKQNIKDLLYLKGVDIAVTHSDVFEEFKKEGKINNISKRVNYISQVHVAGVHILARPEIKTLQDLEGKKVGFHGKGTGVAVTASILFERSGIHVEPVYINHALALEKMKTGEMAALVHLLSKGHEFMGKIKGDDGFHLLPVEYDEKFMDYYMPFSLDSNDYPNLIKPGERLETIGVPAVLAVYPWPKGTDRHRKVERFIQYYFSRFDALKKPPYQPEWKHINLGANVPGWTRYWVAQELLDKATANEAANAKRKPGANAEPVPAAVAGALSHVSPPEQQRLYNEFKEWKQQQGGQ
jgi:TRAP-type uncharacterized transport system substrate-binding protein